MINSMTGYGSAEGQLGGVSYVIEIRSVNNRYFKPNIKLPDSVAFLEEDIDKLLRQSLSRGSVNYTLGLKNAPLNALVDIDDRALQSAFKQLDRIASSVDVKCPIDIGSLLAIPGILTPATPDEKETERIRRKVLGLSRRAIKKLKQMRAVEGAALAADLDNHCRAITKNLKRVRKHSQVTPKMLQKKLKNRLNKLLTNGKPRIDEITLAREVAIFADRSDISEEVARLESHLRQFTQCCKGAAKHRKQRVDTGANDLVGRRLDFISQEMLREANTMASKVADADVIHLVIDIKCWIERLKEQIQNIV